MIIIQVWWFISWLWIVTHQTLSDGVNKKKELSEYMIEPINYDKTVIVAKDLNPFGLCNQFNDFARLFHLACLKNTYISIEYLKIDLQKNAYGAIELVINISSTNRNLYDAFTTKSYSCNTMNTIPQIIPYRFMEHFPMKSFMDFNQIRSIKGLNSDLVSSIALRNDLISNLTISHFPSVYYGLHLRMEGDWITYMLLNDYYKLQSWLRLYRNTDTIKDAVKITKDLLVDSKNAKRVLHLLHQYCKSVIQYFDDKTIPIVIATGLGNKEEINEPVKWVYEYFLVYLHSEGYKVIADYHHGNYREIDAAIDLKIMIESKYFIGEKASSFARNIERIRSSKGLPSSNDFCSLNVEADCNPNW